MRETAEPQIAPVIICQTVREEFRLTLVQVGDRKAVDLRTYVWDQEKGKASPTGKGVSISLELWPHFRTAVSSPETWTEHRPFFSLQNSCDFVRGRLVFPEKSLRKTSQEQIFLEHKNFQGIPFIFLKTLPRAIRGRYLSQLTIGPLLWSQFMAGMGKIEELLADHGWLARGEPEEKPKISLPFTMRVFSSRQASRE
ncbi:MAG: transcriptional coactivator p15/PC4 family protein [Desulfobaccales bacterium]